MSATWRSSLGKRELEGNKRKFWKKGDFFNSKPSTKSLLTKWSCGKRLAVPRNTSETENVNYSYFWKTAHLSVRFPNRPWSLLKFRRSVRVAGFVFWASRVGMEINNVQSSVSLNVCVLCVLCVCVCVLQGYRVDGLHSWRPPGSFGLRLLPRPGLGQRHQDPPQL